MDGTNCDVWKTVAIECDKIEKKKRRRENIPDEMREETREKLGERGRKKKHTKQSKRNEQKGKRHKKNQQIRTDDR